MKKTNIFPLVLRKALKALANEKRQIIITYFVLSSKGKIKYSELLEELEIGSNDLSYHLKELTKGNIITRHTSLTTRVETYYEMSDFGSILIQKLFEALPPHGKPRDKKRKAETIFDSYNIHVNKDKTLSNKEAFWYKDIQEIVQAYSIEGE